MKTIKIHPVPVPKEQIFALLEEHSVRVNDSARAYFAHPLFDSDSPSGELRVVIASLRELGFEEGAALPEILGRVPSLGFKLCRPATGLFLRLAWTEQPQSADSVLTGRHRAPDGAVTMLSEILEPDDAFPKGLYLRKVDGELWLRGYRCDALYLWSPDDLFALEE